MSLDRHARTMLPIPDRPAPGLITYDAKDPDTSFPPIEQLLPPEGAPNVLVVLLDDVGFGTAAPSVDRWTRRPPSGWPPVGCVQPLSHHCAVRPDPAALLTGRNHHSVGMGSITETATSAPGNNSLRPNTKAPLALTLKLNGYSTAQFGKCHEVPVWQTSPIGPFDAWPSVVAASSTSTALSAGRTTSTTRRCTRGPRRSSRRPPEEGYHLTDDLTERAIDWVRQQKALMPDKPFFVYFAPGATHAPHHVPTEWADKYKGRFADGWDKQREVIFARQKELGVIGADAQLTERNPEMPAWEDTDPELRPVLERQMEVYAGFMEHTDVCRAADGRHRGAWDPRRHDDHLHHR